METFNIDLIPGRANPVCHVSQYDEGRTIRVNLFEGSSVYTLTGAETVTVNVRKPDGNIVTDTLTNTSDSYVEIVTTEQMTACAGSNLCELSIEDGGDVIGTLNFIMEVERSPLEGGIASQSEINNLQTQVNAFVVLAVADQYDSANVIFDNTPTSGHGTPYTVTSDGIYNAIDAISSPAASAVSYDNTVSGLTATDVQDAIDEVVGSIPAAQVNSDWDAVSGVAQILNKPTLATVATSGSYNDLLNIPVAVDFTSDVTFVGTIGGGTHFWKQGNVAYLNYQGATGTHAQNDLLFTLPAGYRPIVGINPVFIINDKAYGILALAGGTGECRISFISNSTIDGRIYFSIAYPTA